MAKKYEIPETETQMVSESAASIGLCTGAAMYAVPQHDVMYSANIQKTKDVEAFAKKICYTEEAYEYHMRHGFYRTEIPEQTTLDTEEQLVESLDAADAEGYVTNEATNHLMNLWQLVN